MDMLSLCRKRVATDSPEARRRSPRIARKGQPSAAKKTAMSGDKCFANIDATLPAVSHSQNGNVILRIFTKPGDEKSRITGDCFIYYSDALHCIHAMDNLWKKLFKVLQIKVCYLKAFYYLWQIV